MHSRTLEIKRTLNGLAAPGENVIFDEQTVSTPGISYDVASGEITFNSIGQYSVQWWVATETTPKGAMEFALRSSQGDLIYGSSPQKTGQVSGFGTIDILTPGITLSLVNTTATNNVFSIEVVLKAYLLITPMQNIGPTGPQGVIGPTGATGLAATIRVGAVEELPAETPPYVNNVGSESEAILDFGIPTGSMGLTELWGIEAGLLNNQSGTIANESPIIFDTVLSQVGSAISYDNTTGEFILSQNGCYLVNWWVSTDGADGYTGMNFSLNVDGTTHSTGTSQNVTGQVTGSALLNIAVSPAAITLTNICGGRIALEDTNAQANIVIMAISV